MTRAYSRVGVLALLISFAMPVHADEAEWLVAPYAWLSDVSFDQSVDDGASGNISGKDLIDKSDAAGMILSLIHISEPTRQPATARMPGAA